MQSKSSIIFIHLLTGDDINIRVHTDQIRIPMLGILTSHIFKAILLHFFNNLASWWMCLLD